MGEVVEWCVGLFVDADIGAEGDAAVAKGFQPLAIGVDTVIVEAHAVDQGVVFNEAEQARLGVAGLWVAGNGAGFDKGKTQMLQACERLGVFIEAGGKANRMGEVEWAEFGAQVGRNRDGFRRKQLRRDRAECPNGQIVSGFRR